MARRLGGVTPRRDTEDIELGSAEPTEPKSASSPFITVVLLLVVRLRPLLVHFLSPDFCDRALLTDCDFVVLCQSQGIILITSYSNYTPGKC